MLGFDHIEIMFYDQSTKINKNKVEMMFNPTYKVLSQFFIYEVFTCLLRFLIRRVESLTFFFTTEGCILLYINCFI